MRRAIAGVLTAAAGSLLAAGVLVTVVERRGIVAHVRRWWERGCA